MNIIKSATVKKIIASVTALCLVFSLFALIGCGDKTVSKIEVKSEPTKIVYTVGEEFTAEGGVITATYDDGSTEDIPMTDERVTFTGNKITLSDDKIEDEKTVTVTFGGKRQRFKITVKQNSKTFTFDYNYQGSTPTTAPVVAGNTVKRPDAPTRSGHTFHDWYADKDCTILYDFYATVEDNTTVYAKWLEDGATYNDFTYDLNYPGAATIAPVKIKQGEKAAKYGVDPVREGYAFVGWYTDAGGATEFNFASVSVSAATTVYAKWNKTAAGGVKEYVFEAEDMDLLGKNGAGISGTASGKGLIQFTDKHGASNNRLVGYQYDMNLSLEFIFVSDTEVHDAEIILRLSAEMRDITISPDNYQIWLNSENVQYTPIAFTNVPPATSEDTDLHCLPFKDYVIKTNGTLKAGRNMVTLTVNNDVDMPGTTVKAISPLVDCLKIKTEAVLAWDASQGLPKKDNY